MIVGERHDACRDGEDWLGRPAPFAISKACKKVSSTPL